MHCLAAAETRLPLESTVESTEGKNTRYLLSLVIFSREGDALVQAARLAGGLAAGGRHDLLEISLVALANLTSDLTASAGNASSAKTAAGHVGVNGAPVPNVTIQRKSIGTSEAAEARKAYNEGARVGGLSSLVVERLGRRSGIISHDCFKSVVRNPGKSEGKKETDVGRSKEVSGP